MTIVSIGNNTTTVSRGSMIQLNYRGHPIGCYESKGPARRQMDKDRKVLESLGIGQEVWLDETHYHTYPSGDSGPIHYGRVVTIRGVSERMESSIRFARAQTAGRLIRPTLSVGKIRSF